MCVCVNVYTYIYNLVNFLQKVYYWINNKGLDAKKNLKTLISKDVKLEEKKHGI